MYNKTKIKKYINDGKKNILMFDRTKGWMTDGYSMISTNFPGICSVLDEMFYKTEKASFRDKSGTDEEFDYNRMLNICDSDLKPLKITPYLMDSGKLSLRVFINENGAEILLQKKYTDIFNEWMDLDYLQSGDCCSPIYVKKEEDIVGLILPVRTQEGASFKVVIAD